jgi:hypothetical protein
LSIVGPTAQKATLGFDAGSIVKANRCVYAITVADTKCVGVTSIAVENVKREIASARENILNFWVTIELLSPYS